MQYKDEGPVCALYIERTDNALDSIFETIRGITKPIKLVIPAPQLGKPSQFVFSKPEHYSRLKHLLRQEQEQLPPIYLISSSTQFREQAQRNGFVAYESSEAFSAACEEVLQSASVTSMQNGHQANMIPLQTSAHYASMQTKPQNADSQVSPALTSPKRPKKRYRWLLIVAVVLILAIILGTSFYFVKDSFQHASTNASTNIGTAQALQPVGSVYFLSSEQVNETSTQGINDEVELDLRTMASPSAGHALYAWLLPDKNRGDANALLIGELSVTDQRTAYLLYAGDRQHTNLLAIYSRFLVTEEGESIIPIAPSPNTSTWRYYAEIPQVTSAPGAGSAESGARTFSVLDHLRHLLVNDPALSSMGLPGGLNNWLYRNTGKLLEWSESARDYDRTDPQFLRRQIIRILAYLDGLTFVQQDLPPNTYLPLTTKLVRMGLIDVQVNQQVPSYLSHIIFHLNGLLNSVGVTSEQRARASQIVTALDQVHTWFVSMRLDAQRLMALSDAQLFSSQAMTLYNDMVILARAANDGQINPASAQIQEGVVFVHMMLSSLATLAVYPYPSHSVSH